MRVESASGRTRITSLARRWRWQRLAAWVLAAIMAAAGVFLAFGNLFVAAAVALLPLLGAWRVNRRRPITPSTVARHLDRELPALEESAGLLLDPDDAGNALERMQRRRVASAFSSLGDLPRLKAPTTGIALAAGGACLLVAALLMAIPERAPASAGNPNSSPDSLDRAPLDLRTVTLQWTPPSYLGRASRTVAAANATVEEGSQVQWQVEAPGATQVRIVDLLGDTLLATRSDGRWVAAASVSRPRVWRVEALGARDELVRGEAYLLAVTLDRPPVIAIVAPPGRTEMEWTEPHRVVIRAVVSDDHAIGSAELIATVAAGRGEGVRFRERRLPLERESTTGPGEQVVSAMVDLDALEVTPGDEVYLAVEASDRRAPVPQVARSETVFLAIRDTLDPVETDFGGIAIDIEPEFFRSQRQIILDTEALLADVRAVRVREPLPRAMEIGYDQYLLRVRYGEIAGQEDELNGADPNAVITEADLMHQHDTEDNATLLAATVKATLQEALAAMWEAEKQLRTGHPNEALPHEYRALVALEQIRQAQRAYVKRIGFEPPAIDVGRTRLTKEAKDVASLDRREPASQFTAGEELRTAIVAIDASPDLARTMLLDAAARRLAREALNDLSGKHLETLGALRRLLDGDETIATRNRVRSGLLAALPAPPRPIVPAKPQ